MSVAFHTVFILNENIKWLEEFIIYYINLGISHFYLYDNEGSEENEGGPGINKYGFTVNTTSTKEERAAFNDILLKYNKYITHILWQPKIGDKIRYKQPEAITDCIKQYGHLHEWICFLDLDEFIFSKENVNLVDYLNSLDKNISAVKLIQKKFLDRFLSKEKYITQEFGCIDNLKIGVEWAPKNIIRPRDFISLTNPHTINTKRTTLIANVDTLRFNHYNVNQKQLNWMKGFYRSDTPFIINGADDGMKRYSFLFE
jgi:hypothetical protein